MLSHSLSPAELIAARRLDMCGADVAGKACMNNDVGIAAEKEHERGFVRSQGDRSSCL